MRHLGSILLSVILAPVIYLLAGIGVAKLSIGAEKLSTGALIGFVALLGAGALYAVLMLARLSPAGTLLAGLAYLAVSAWFLVSPGMVNHLPHSVIGVQGAATFPLGGVAAVLAVPLLATVFSARRWRAAPGGAGFPGGGYQAPASYLPGAEPPVSRFPVPGYPPAPAPAVLAPGSGRTATQPGPGQSGASQLPEPVGPYQPQMASYAPPNPASPPPAPLWPSAPGQGTPTAGTFGPGTTAPEPEDTDGTRRL